MNNDFGSTPFVGASPDFLHFVNLCEQVRVTKSKNMKVGLLSRYLSSMDDESWLSYFYPAEYFHSDQNSS